MYIYIYIYIFIVFNLHGWIAFLFVGKRGNSSYWLCQFSGFGFKCSSKWPPIT